MSNKTFQEIIDRSLEVINEFEKVEKRSWGAEGIVIELMKQVGEISKLIMVTEGYYMAGRDSLPEYKSSKKKIGDELADIFFMTIRLANHYGIDLEEVHLRELDRAMNHPLMKVEPENK